MFVPKIGFLEWEDTRRFPYEVLFLFGAGFSIASAFSTTGLASELAQKLSMISEFPLFWMLVIVAFVVTFSTEVTSNTALTSIAVPIFYEFSKEMPYHEGTMLLMVATVAASYAFMLPIATPPNAIVMSSGVITSYSIHYTKLYDRYISTLQEMSKSPNAKFVIYPADLQEAVKGMLGNVFKK